MSFNPDIEELLGAGARKLIEYLVPEEPEFTILASKNFRAKYPGEFEDWMMIVRDEWDGEEDVDDTLIDGATGPEFGEVRVRGKAYPALRDKGGGPETVLVYTGVRDSWQPIVELYR